MSKVAPLIQREFHINQHELNHIHHFPNNFVKTAKYSLLTFFPKTIFIQFQRYANIYFLIIAILQSISVISPLNPFTAIAPLVCVIGLSLLREAIEDMTRHRSDKEANARTCNVLKDGVLIEQQWKDIQVGDIIYITESDFFPADMLVIASANPNGLCFIETSSLDGEKNLKPRTAPKETLDLYKPDGHELKLKGQISCIQPNPMLSSFDGTLTLEEGQKVILNVKQLLYRGAKLKNTAWIVGVAVYTGNDTKVMKNSESSKNKQSKVERLTNRLIIRIFVFQMLVCLGCAIGAFVFNQVYLDDHSYIKGAYSSGVESLLLFFSYFLLNNTMIPISLIVSLELVKIAQAYFIERDQELFNKESGRRATVFTSAINEELGQVEYLFTDKTGTLTCNKMEFKIAVIGEEMYGDTQIVRKSTQSTNQIEPQQPEQEKTIADSKESNESSNQENKGGFSFEDKRLASLLKGEGEDKLVKLVMHTADKSKKTYEITKQSDLVKEYFTVLSTCHECLVEKHSNGSQTYQGPSPDEVTLVDTAHRLGYSFIGGSENNKKITALGEEHDFQVLHSFEFNSDRKRMSVILKDSKGHIKLYIKGADTIIKSRLKHIEEQPYLKYIDKKLDMFARKGLRTLLIGMKVLDMEEYKAFLEKYMAVANSTEKEKEIDRLADGIERDLYLIGATAVEDRLQDNVPQTIYDFIQANIKVWMLTGDKLETAENIAKSCNLIQDEFQVLHCSEKTKEEVQNILEKHKKFNDYFLANGIKKALIIEGESLAIVLHDPTLTSLFVSIATTCEAVVCCRVTPKQKADVVRLVKHHLGKITLAIGDGANDVNMIQEAHIGVGLYGQEGMRAVQSSDFALPEFQGLWRLLFVHGRWSYVRITEMILYFFYKNMIFTIPQFFFAFVCAFSGQTVFDDFYITTYNLIFTAFPLLIRAAFDQDVNYIENSSDEKSDQPQTRTYIKKYFPKLYYMGQQNKLFNEKKFLKSVLQGIFHSALLFTITFLSLSNGMLDDSGKNVDFYYISITLYTSIILIVDMKIAVYTKYWTILTTVSLIILSLLLYFAYLWFVDSFTDRLVSQTAIMLFSSMHFYSIVFLNFGVILLFDAAYVYIKSQYYGELADYFREIIKRKDYFSEGAFTGLFKPRVAIRVPEFKASDMESPIVQNNLKQIDSERTLIKTPQVHDSADGLLKSQSELKPYENDLLTPSRKSLVMEGSEIKKEERKPRQLSQINALKKEVRLRPSIMSGK